MKVIILFYLLVPLQLQAFTLNSSTNSNLEGWSDSTITLNVNASNCPAAIDVPGLINEAAEIWNNAPTSRVKVSYGSTTTSTTYAAPTTVYCETNFQAVTGADQNYVPAAASVGTNGNRISQGLLYINASAGQANISNFDRTKLKIIVAHEIGHILGLGHSEKTEALMYYDATNRATLTLAQDDIDGITYLYPKDELSGQQIMGCGLISTAKPPSSSTCMILLFLLLIPVFLYAYFRSNYLLHNLRN